MSEASKRTLNGYKKGHPMYLKRHSEETKKRLRLIALADGRKPDFTGRKHTEESKKKMSETRKANPNMYWLGKDRSAIFTKEYRQKMSIASKKVVAEGRHNFFIDGRTPENKIQRTSVEMKLWREAVFKRDNWTCQDCGERGGKLHAHHVKSFSQHPLLRFEVSNGRTLCIPCHKKTDTYLKRLDAQPALAGAAQ